MEGRVAESSVESIYQKGCETILGGATGHAAAIQIMLMQVMLYGPLGFLSSRQVIINSRGSTIATNNTTASILILEAKVDYQKTIQAIILKALAQ